MTIWIQIESGEWHRGDRFERFGVVDRVGGTRAIVGQIAHGQQGTICTGTARRLEEQLRALVERLKDDGKAVVSFLTRDETVVVEPHPSPPAGEPDEGHRAD